MRKYSFILGILLIMVICSACCYLLITPDPPVPEEARPSWAPDHRQIVYECYLEGPVDEGSLPILSIVEPEESTRSFYRKEAADLCIVDTETGKFRRIVKAEGGDWQPQWSPDGSQIAYLRDDGLYLVTPEGQDQRRLVAFRPSYGMIDLQWSPAGDRLLFSDCLDKQDFLRNPVFMKQYRLPDMDLLAGFDIGWAPNSQEFVTTLVEEIDGTIGEEKHIYIFNVDGTAQPVIIQHQ